MEFVPGINLQTLLPSLTAKEKIEIIHQIKGIILELRKLEPPDHLGGLHHSPYSDAVFWTPDNNPAISGPFDNQTEINNGILERLRQSESPHYVKLLEGMINSILHGHCTVFTHGDLQPKNIMVDRVGSHEDGSRIFKISLIDWEIAGWYPEYWEFCSSNYVVSVET